jgi:nucleoside-diphosphate-sugar epimerase
MEIVIVRPPLIYGPGVKGNFLNLLRLVDSGAPLPLGLCQNRRSLVGLKNFAGLLRLCVSHPAAADRTFVVSDGEDMSTPELLRRLGRALGRTVRLFPFPLSLLRGSALLTGQRRIYDRMCGSLQVDSSQLQRVLGWHPPSTVDRELGRLAEWYRRLAKT